MHGSRARPAARCSGVLARFVHAVNGGAGAEKQCHHGRKPFARRVVQRGHALIVDVADTRPVGQQRGDDLVLPPGGRDLQRGEPERDMNVGVRAGREQERDDGTERLVARAQKWRRPLIVLELERRLALQKQLDHRLAAARHSDVQRCPAVGIARGDCHARVEQRANPSDVSGRARRVDLVGRR